MLRKVLCVTLAVLMLCAMCTVALVSAGAETLPEKAEGTNRYFFYMPDEWKNEYADTASIYWWVGTDACESWPGYFANETDTDGVYYYDVPEDVYTVIWNNSVDAITDTALEEYSFQTANIGTEYYDPGESENYPEGTYSFDGMIYVIDPTLTSVSDFSGKTEYKGEWYYYYGGGEYGFTPEKGDEVFTGRTRILGSEDDTTEDVTTPDETYRYYFYMPDEWMNDYTDKAGIYWWTGTNACESWPGYTANKADAQGLYYYDVPKDVDFVIWNNALDGGSDPTLDIYTLATQTVNIGTEYYDKGESENYPEGTQSFDGMVYVTDPTLTTANANGREIYKGEWYYYYGGGEYGFTPEKGDEVFTGKTHVISGEDDTTEDVTTPDETYRYYFYMPDEWKNDYTDTAGIYWWTGTNACESWPGYTANKADAQGLYYYDVPKDVDFVIWNNALDGGSDPTLDIYTLATQTVNIGTEYYDKGESENYPEGTENFDGMIYVTDPTLTTTNANGREIYKGEWYYYYGGGEYGFTPEKGEEVFTGKTHVISGEEVTTPTEDTTEDTTVQDTTAQTDPTESTVSTEATDPTESTVSTEATDPTESTVSTEATDPTESTVSTEATDSTETTTEETTPTEETTQDTTADDTTPSFETYRYYFYLPDEWKNEYTDKAGIYWWTGTSNNMQWPGLVAIETDTEGVYYYDVPRDVDFVIWNNALNGGEDSSSDIYHSACQTENIGTEYYEKGESENYPEGTQNFDGMIYVIDPTLNPISAFYGKPIYEGEWYYYYGNGEYGFTPEKGDEVFTGSTHIIDPEVTLTDDRTQISVEGILDAELTVREITSDEEIADIDLILIGEKAGKVYDITLVSDGAEVQPDGTVTVRIPAVDETSRVYRMEADGTLTDMLAVYEDGYLVFTTEHFSLYVVTESLGFELGDVNMDGVVNVKDATAIQKHLASLITLSDDALTLADFDANDNLNIKDATAIQKSIAGLL